MHFMELSLAPVFDLFNSGTYFYISPNFKKGLFVTGKTLGAAQIRKLF